MTLGQRDNCRHSKSVGVAGIERESLIDLRLGRLPVPFSGENGAHREVGVRQLRIELKRLLRGVTRLSEYLLIDSACIEFKVSYTPTGERRPRACELGIQLERPLKMVDRPLDVSVLRGIGCDRQGLQV